MSGVHAINPRGVRAVISTVPRPAHRAVKPLRTKQGMADGVRGSAVFVLFLSKDVLQRPFVRFEVGEALKHGKQILLIHESDDRHHPFDFASEVGKAPTWLQEIIQNHESLPWRRRGFERDAVVDQLIARARFPAPTEETEEAVAPEAESSSSAATSGTAPPAETQQALAVQ